MPEQKTEERYTFFKAVAIFQALRPSGDLRLHLLELAPLGSWPRLAERKMSLVPVDRGSDTNHCGADSSKASDLKFTFA